MLTSVNESGSVVNDQNSGCKSKRSEADPAATSMSPTYSEILEPPLAPVPQQATTATTAPQRSAKTPSPSATPSVLHLFTSPVIALGNPIATRTSPLTTSITTTTSKTATPIKSAANVRAHFNLIGGEQITKMATDTLTDIGSSDSSSSATTMIVVADFHDDNHSGSSSSNTSRTTTKTTQRIDTDNALISDEQQSLRRATQEHKSKLTTTVEAAPTTMATTSVDTHTLRRKKLHESQLPAASSDKSEPHENKCAAKACQTLSYSREVELNRSKESSLELDLNTTDVSKHKGEGLSERQERLSFAERNQKLKADFLADLSEQPQQIRGNTEGVIRDETSKLDLKDRATRRKAPQHLKLHIPAPNKAQQPQAAAAVVLEAVLEPPKLTLVARRKLELKRRFEQQTQERRSAEHATAANKISAHFPSVQELKQRFDQQPSKHKMIVQPQKLSDTASPESSAGNYLALKATALEQRQSPLSDEGCNLGQSPYSSDEDNVSIRTISTTVERKRKDKVARSASSDSALGLDVEEPEQPPPVQHDKQRRMTLTVTDLPLRPALLPLAEPTALPDSPTTDAPITVLSQATIPSKVLLEERVVEIPEDPRIVTGSHSTSRRESAQSCLSDYPLGECPGVRFVRTPSVVVSDYSDDVMCGITLEEIEYFRAQRLRRRRSSLDTTSGTEKDGMDGGTHSDVSASSSCSNLYYCGSTISALDGAECYVNGMRMPLAGERKASACSTCSASGGEEDDAVYSIPEQPEEADGHLGKDLAELLAAQQLNTKRPKKVGICEKCRSASLNEAD